MTSSSRSGAALWLCFSLLVACSGDDTSTAEQGGAGQGSGAAGSGQAGAGQGGAVGAAGAAGAAVVPNVCQKDADCQLFQGCDLCEAAPLGAVAPASDGNECFATLCQSTQVAGARCIQGSCQLTYGCTNVLPATCEVPCKEGEQLKDSGCSCVSQAQCRARTCGDKSCGRDEVCVTTHTSGGPAPGSSTTTQECKPLPAACQGVPTCGCVMGCSDGPGNCQDTLGQIQCTVALP
jgi:hypothetical protein